MPLRFSILAILAALIIGGYAAERADAQTFAVKATKTYEWEGGELLVAERVTASAHKESEIWVPCGGTPPGLTLRYEAPGYAGANPTYSLVDSEGKVVALCGSAPEFIYPIPHRLSISFESGCKRAESGFGSSLDLKITEVTATPGTATFEEVSFERAESYPAPYGKVGALEPVCVLAHDSYTTPNQECAEFFDASLCADETHHLTWLVGSTRFRYVFSPTDKCPAVRKAKKKLSRQLRRVSSNAERLEAHPALMRKFNRLNRRYGDVYERWQGECL